jgi:glycerophosphoryl diester phosphodiesterase
MGQLVDLGVDGIISDYPDRLHEVLVAKGAPIPDPVPSPFDVEGHRGARWYRPENTIQAFEYGLDHGIDTLELDTGVTADGQLVVLHDRRINGVHCTGPYVGMLVRDLTPAQVQELDCGHTDPGFPDQVDVTPGPDATPTLQEVFDLVAARGTSASGSTSRRRSVRSSPTPCRPRRSRGSSSRRSRRRVWRTGP